MSILPPSKRVGETPRHYALAYYLAGLALECLFRAYTELVGGVHDASHDLRRHAEAGRFLSFIPEAIRDEARADLGDVWTRWRNNHRYRGLASLRAFLNEEQLYRLPGGNSVRGDVVFYNWIILLEAATRLLTVRIQRWEIS